MLGFPLLYFKGMRLLMFQLSGFYYSYTWSSACIIRFCGCTRVTAIGTSSRAHISQLRKKSCNRAYNFSIQEASKDSETLAR